MISSIIEKLFAENNIGNIKISKSNRPDLCDYQSNDVFRISKELKKIFGHLTMKALQLSLNKLIVTLKKLSLLQTRLKSL